MKLSSLILLLFSSLFLNAQKGDLKFIENKGQLLKSDGTPADEILFYADEGNIRYVIRKTGVSYLTLNVLTYEEYEEMEEEEEKKKARELKKKKITEHELPTPTKMKPHMMDEINLWRVDMNWVNTSSSIEHFGQEPYSHKLNYYNPRFPNGLIGVSTYKKVLLKNIYPNIDVLFYSNGTQFKYDYIVNEGGNIANITFEFAGAKSVKLDKDILKIKTPYAIIKDFIPKSEGISGGKSTNLNLKFTRVKNTLFGITSNNPLQKFEKIIIDPSVWITYLGGLSDEFATDIEADLNGHLYITGHTFSTDFPVTAGAFQTTPSVSSYSPFLSKFHKDGYLLWSTYYYGSGSSYDVSYGVCVDGLNNPFICGNTGAADFPTTVGAYQTTLNGIDDAFVIKFDEFGVRQWATLIGGSSGETAFKINSDQSNNVWLTGGTKSTDFPTFNPYQPVYGGGTEDAFITSFSSTGGLLYSSFHGGAAFDEGTDIDFTPGFIGITGYTQGTTGITIPITVDAYDNTVLSGEYDAFYTKIDLLGNVIYSTYLGGAQMELPSSIEYDGLGDVVISGNTYSTDFPITAGAYQSLHGGGSLDCYITKFSSANIIDWSTYYGNTYMEYGGGLSFDEYNNIYFFSEWEDDAFVDLPVLGCAFQKEFGGTEDQFIVKFSPDCNLECMSYLGGLDEDDLDGAGSCIEYSDGYIYTACYSMGSYPVSPGAYQTTMSGFTEMCIARLCSIGCGDTSSTKASFTVEDTVCTNIPVQFLASSISCDTSLITYAWNFSGGVPATSSIINPVVTYNTAGSYLATLTVTSPCDSAVKTFTITVTDHGSLTLALTQSEDTICPGLPVTINSSAGGGMAPYSYQWSTATTDTLSSIILSPTSSGYIYLEVFDNSSCSYVKDSVFITVLNFPTIVAPADSCICSGSNITLTASGTPSYNWNTGGTTPSIIVSPTSGTLYIVTYTDGVCTTTDSTFICTHLVPTVTINAPDSICAGTSVLFSSTVTSGTSPFNYSWSGVISGTSSTITSTPLTSGSISLLIDDTNGCSASASVFLTVLAVPDIISSPDTCVCIGSSIILNATGTPTYDWNTGQTSASITVSPTVDFIYIVSYSNGVCADDDSTTVCVHPLPVVNASSDTTMAFGSSVMLAATGAGSFEWSPANSLSCTTCSNPEASPNETTTYIVTTTNIYGCKSSDEVTVSIFYVLVIPNIITPNQDGLNDKFNILGLPPNSAIQIYNRWGNLLFETPSYNNDWSTITDGVYYYVLKTPDSETYNGFFHVNNK